MRRQSRSAGGTSDLLGQSFRDYSIYGISIRSHFPIAHCDAVARPRAPRVIIAKSRVPLAAGEWGPEPWFTQKLLPDGSVYLRWSGLFEFLISANGRRISSRELKDSTPEAFSTYLLGQVLSFGLVKQGLESLHASAIVVDGGSIGFLGDCGQGKSTLLASFLQEGLKQLTDDLLLVRRKRDLIISYPGPLRIKLLPASAFLLGKQAQGVAMNPLVPKMVIPVAAKKFQRTPVPLKALYLLAQGGSSQRIRITAIPHAKALLGLVTNSFNISLKDPPRLERQFRWATEIVSSIPVRQISYPRNYDALPAVRAAILNQFSLDN